MMPIESVVPDGVKLEGLLENVGSLCWGAADILRAYARGEKPPYGFPAVLNVNDGVDGPVSAADLAVNQWLLDGLNSYYPTTDWTLLSEETAKEQLIEGASVDTEWLWILDPLDGTKDFLQGTGDYAVHLALVKGSKTVLGVVLIPEADELWFGVRGLGAWLENRSGEKKSVSFSDRKSFSELILVASRNHRDDRLEKLLGSLNLAGTKSIGSVGCKVATILRGETDFYISLSGRSAPKDWDMAAPEAVLSAAGGMFTHADGIPLKYNTGDIRQAGCLVASHGFLHPEICQKVLKEINFIDPTFLV